MTAPSIPVLFAVPGGLELLLLLLVVLLLFGATRIPELARSTGQAAGEFKRGRRELQEREEDGER